MYYFVNTNQHEIECRLCHSYRFTLYASKLQVLTNAACHLEKEHRIQLERTATQKETLQRAKGLSTRSDKIIVELVCRWGMATVTLDEDPFFKEAFRTMQLNKPDSAKLAILNEFKRVTDRVRSKVATEKQKGQRFVLSLSTLNYQGRQWGYLCLHLNEGPICLGMDSSIIGTVKKKSLRWKELLAAKLGEYQLDFTDILCVVGTNGRELEDLPSKTQYLTSKLETQTGVKTERER